LQEVEYLFPPGSFMQRTGEDCVECTPDGPVRIIGARVNANNTMRTTEELLAQKKTMHLAAFEYSVEELGRWLEAKREAFEGRLANDPFRMDDCSSFEGFTAGLTAQVSSYMMRHKEVDSAAYHDDDRYRAMVIEMLDARRMAESKMELYLADQSQVLVYTHSMMSLREAHRALLSFQSRNMHKHGLDEAGRKERALALCRAEGLVRASVDEVNEAGEPIMVQGAADGWDHDKLWLLQCAGADVNSASSSESRMTPLMSSASCGRAATVRALVDLQAAVNQTTHEDSALSWAAFAGHTDVVRLLVDLKADVNPADNNVSSGLHMAAQCGHVDAVKALLELGADVNLVNQFNGFTALIFASSGGHMPVIEALCDAGADVNYKNEDGMTAILGALAGQHTNAVRALIARGADASQALLVAATNTENSKECLVAIRTMAAAGADVNRPVAAHGTTALMAAAAEGLLARVQALVEVKADVGLRDEEGETAAARSAKAGHRRVAMWLAKSGGVGAGVEMVEGGSDEESGGDLDEWPGGDSDEGSGGDSDEGPGGDSDEAV
jgi:ankyrin repeat protein